MQINLKDLVIPADRLRKVDPRTVEGLAEDFRNPEMGMINPITVWKRSDGKWELIAGEHRVHAALAVKWETIRAEQWQWQIDNPSASDEEVSLRSRYVEASENMKRKALSSADITYTDGVLLETADKLKKFAKADTLEADLKAAEADDDEEELARLRKVKRDREFRARRANASSSLSRVERAETGVLETVATETGRSVQAVRKSVERRNAVGGLDMTAKLRGTSLSTEDEMLAVGELRKLAPEKAERVLVQATENKQVSAVKVLEEVKADKRAADQKAKEEEALNDQAQAAQMVRDFLPAITGGLRSAKAKAKNLRIADACPELDKALDQIAALNDRLGQFVIQSRKAKRLGNEAAKYPLVDPATTKARDQAKADQAKNASVPAAKLKAKKKVQPAATTR